MAAYPKQTLNKVCGKSLPAMPLTDGQIKDMTFVKHYPAAEISQNPWTVHLPDDKRICVRGRNLVLKRLDAPRRWK
jgi:hypothetical protein